MDSRMRLHRPGSFVAVVFLVLSLASTGAAQTPAPSSALQLPENAVIFASLNTPISMDQIKSGAALEAVTTRDVKQGHAELLKKGATLLGHVNTVQPTNGAGEQVVIIAFDRVKPKKGEETALHLVIQALAPTSDMQTGNVSFSDGRGVQGATQATLPGGYSSATSGSVNPLSEKSHGVQDLRGLDLRERIENNEHLTVLAATRKNIELRKGTQLLMRVANP